ncbi:MAG: hypothetical protein JNL32_06420 [Candidatus Kapabacteria bacterium]|nr:hypothetical protein [Candidatus Kapabacteria bacterium]
MTNTGNILLVLWLLVFAGLSSLGVWWYQKQSNEQQERVKVTVQIMAFVLNPLAPIPHDKSGVTTAACKDSCVTIADAPKRTIRRRYTRSDAVLYTNDLLFETDTISLRDGAKIRIRFYDAEEPVDFDYIPAPR